MESFGNRAWLFFLFVLAIVLIWISFGPLARQVVAATLNRVGLKDAAIYVDSA